MSGRFCARRGFPTPPSSSTEGVSAAAAGYRAQFEQEATERTEEHTGNEISKTRSESPFGATTPEYPVGCEGYGSPGALPAGRHREQAR
jgi:hypothetical protein